MLLLALAASTEDVVDRRLLGAWSESRGQCSAEAMPSLPFLVLTRVRSGSRWVVDTMVDRAADESALGHSSEFSLNSMPNHCSTVSD